MYVFLYDEMMDRNNLAKIMPEEMILSIRPAMAVGKMIDAERTRSMYAQNKLKSRFPVLITPKNIEHPLKKDVVYGACIEFTDDYSVFKYLDAYYNCSMYPLGENKPTDLFFGIS